MISFDLISVQGWQLHIWFLLALRNDFGGLLDTNVSKKFRERSPIIRHLQKLNFSPSGTRVSHSLLEMSISKKAISNFILRIANKAFACIYLTFLFSKYPFYMNFFTSMFIRSVYPNLILLEIRTYALYKFLILCIKKIWSFQTFGDYLQIGAITKKLSKNQVWMPETHTSCLVFPAQK